MPTMEQFSDVDTSGHLNASFTIDTPKDDSHNEDTNSTYDAGHSAQDHSADDVFRGEVSAYTAGDDADSAAELPDERIQKIDLKATVAHFSHQVTAKSREIAAEVKPKVQHAVKVIQTKGKETISKVESAIRSRTDRGGSNHQNSHDDYSLPAFGLSSPSAAARAAAELHSVVDHNNDASAETVGIDLSSGHDASGYDQSPAAAIATDHDEDDDDRGAQPSTTDSSKARLKMQAQAKAAFARASQLGQLTKAKAAAAYHDVAQTDAAKRISAGTSAAAAAVSAQAKAAAPKVQGVTKALKGVGATASARMTAALSRARTGSAGAGASGVGGGDAGGGADGEAE